MFRGNLLYRLLGQNLYPLHRFRLSKSWHRFPRNALTLISHIITTGSPLLLSDIVTDDATNRIYTGFSPHLHCRTQKRPCQFGRNSEPTKSFSYTYLLRVLPQISFSSQAKGFAPNEDKSFAPGIPIWTNEIIQRFVSWYLLALKSVSKVYHESIKNPKPLILLGFRLLWYYSNSQSLVWCRLF